MAVLAGLLVLALLVLLMWKVRLGEGGAAGEAPLSGCGVVLAPTVPFIQHICVEHLLTCASIYPGPGCFRDKSDVDLVLRPFVVEPGGGPCHQDEAVDWSRKHSGNSGRKLESRWPWKGLRKVG